MNVKKVGELYEKKEWSTMRTCRDFLRQYAINKKFEYRQKNNDNLKIEFVYKEPSCKWRVYVRRVPREHTVRCRSYHPKHTCKNDKKGKNCLAKASWVGNQIGQQIRDHKEYKPKDMQTDI